MGGPCPAQYFPQQKVPQTKKNAERPFLYQRLGLRVVHAGRKGFETATCDHDLALPNHKSFTREWICQRRFPQAAHEFRQHKYQRKYHHWPLRLDKICLGPQALRAFASPVIPSFRVCDTLRNKNSAATPVAISYGCLPNSTCPMGQVILEMRSLV